MTDDPMLINEPLDISEDFSRLQNDLFVAGNLKNFDPAEGKGSLQWQYHRWVTDRAFNTGGMHLKKMDQREEFWREQPVHPVLDFSIAFINDRTIRLQMKTKITSRKKDASLMLVQHNCSEDFDETPSRALKSLKRLLRFRSFHSPRFKPWAMKSR